MRERYGILEAMAHPLAGAWQKVGRARQHLDILKHETDIVARKNPCKAVSEDDPKTGHVVLRVRLPNGPFQIPSRLGLIAGDAVHNLRSALDHLAYQLAKAGTGATRTTQFPLMEDPDDYRDREGRLLAGIVERHRTVIKSLQPYHARQPPQSWIDSGVVDLRDPLAMNLSLLLIGRLDNIDKHRGLLPGTALAPFVQPQFEGVIRATGTYPSEAVRMEDGAELYRITELERKPGAEVKVKTKPSITITFGNPEWGKLGSPTDIWSRDDKIAGTRTDILQCADDVERILAMFAADLGPSPPAAWAP